ncbi:hypothetical protein [Pseudomonas fluorescens]|uniref:hypothetical protein n=1 Tax=Pseudomonas fluorescens TaxID=294 RepID=UPI00123F734B|nr:hypothetical protein [Pseudomonas fluorescens]
MMNTTNSTGRPNEKERLGAKHHLLCERCVIVGASLLAMDVNDNALFLNKRAALETIVMMGRLNEKTASAVLDDLGQMPIDHSFDNRAL